LASKKHILELLAAAGAEGRTGFNIGLEREALRINSNGELSTNPHPLSLGHSLTNPAITTDYAESQLEFVTKPKPNTKDVLQNLGQIMAYASNKIDGELLWNLSMPAILPAGDIPIALFGNSNAGVFKHIYRKGLRLRYGDVMQAISGLHFNFSLQETFFDFLYKHLAIKAESRNNFKTNLYMALTRNLLSSSWLLTYLFGASPAADVSFFTDPSKRLTKAGRCSYMARYATSLRMSQLGYVNSRRCNTGISYNKFDDFLVELRTLTEKKCKIFADLGIHGEADEYMQLNHNILQIENELYEHIRLKPSNQGSDRLLINLELGGVDYVELRGVDIDPFVSTGMNVSHAEFLKLYLFYCMFSPSPKHARRHIYEYKHNQNKTALMGRRKYLRLYDEKKPIDLQSFATKKLDEFEQFLNDTGMLNQSAQDTIKIQRQKIADPSLLPSNQIWQSMADQGIDYFEFGLQASRQMKQEFSQTQLPQPFIKKMDKIVKDSIRDFNEIEGAPKSSFSQYVETFFSEPKVLTE